MSGEIDAIPAVGQLAPDFTLTNQFGEQVSLSGFRGDKNVILFFYPAAFTTTCTSELRSMRDRTTDFDAEGAVVLGISCDRVPSLKIYATQEKIAYSLLSDFWPHGDVAREYGVFLDSHGIATRGTFLIDRDGIVRWSLVTGPREARDVDDIVAAVSRLALGD